MRDSGILELLKDKIPELRNSEILFSIKIPNYEKFAMASQFNLTRFHDVIIVAPFSNSEIPDPRWYMEIKSSFNFNSTILN